MCCEKTLDPIAEVTVVRAPRLSVRPRTLVIVMALIVVATVVAVWLTLGDASHPGRVDLASLSEDSTATVGLAGVFPPEDREALANPLGIVTDGELLYVAESDAGRIRVFDDRGGEVGTIGLPRAKGMSTVYPSALALAAEGQLAVVDNAGSRVIVVSAEPAESAKIVMTLGGNGGTGQPTSVAYADGEYFVFDAALPGVRVFDSTGKADRTIAADLEPQIAFASGMAAAEGTLFVTDSNAGRVLALDAASGELRFIFDLRFTLPRAVVPAREGQAFVVDTFDRAIYVTDADGAGTDAIDEQSVPEGPLASPRGAAWLESEGRLYVTDAGTGRVVVYNVRGE